MTSFKDIKKLYGKKVSIIFSCRKDDGDDAEQDGAVNFWRLNSSSNSNIPSRGYTEIQNACLVSLTLAVIIGFLKTI